MCSLGFNIHDEDLTHGNILYINNFWSRKDDRDSIVNVLTHELYEMNMNFNIICWHREAKDKEIRIMDKNTALRLWGVS